MLCCYHTLKSFGNLKSVLVFLLHGALVTFVPSAYFAIRVFGKWCFPPDVFKVGFDGGCAEGGIAGSGMATSAGRPSVELEDLHANPSVKG